MQREGEIQGCGSGKLPFKGTKEPVEHISQVVLATEMTTHLWPDLQAFIPNEQ